MSEQITGTILMVRPANFGFNEETASNNAFQSNDTILSAAEISIAAQREFEAMVTGLRQRGIQVIVVEDTVDPIKTDALFPNNWFNTHADGSLHLFPMFSPNRRKEVRQDVLELLSSRYEYHVDDRFRIWEEREKFLESTGSMVLDREHKIIYACHSIRTDRELLEEYADAIGYEALGFDAFDDDGQPYYHTNVIMALGDSVAILCTESIVDEVQKEKVLQRLAETNKNIVNISRGQVLSYVGNMLQIKNRVGKTFFVMSTSAFKSLTKSHKQIIGKDNMILHFDLSTIEKFGGGSARCMMAEIFIPEIKTKGILP